MKPLFAWLLFLLLAAPLHADVLVIDQGAWPKTWPQELEPLRASSRTADIGTLLQQHIHEIPIPDKLTFDKVWPAVLKLRTPGSPISLYRHGSEAPKNWPGVTSNQQPTIRIYAPSGGICVDPRLNLQPGRGTDYEKLVKEGKALKAGAPWPEYLPGKQGELPQFVVGGIENGEFRWLPAFVPGVDRQPRGFLHRARIDVELVVDGQVIDLNWVKLPADASIQDHRFDVLEEQPAP